MQTLAAAAPAISTSGLTTLGIVSLVATSSVFAALLTQFFGWVRDWLRDRREGKFAALYLAHALNAYTKACAHTVDDVGNHAASDGAVGRRHSNIPILPEYPEVNWGALGIVLTEAVMEFRVAIDEEREGLEFQLEVDDGEDVEAAAIAEAIERGIAAADMARRLRARWKLREPAMGWAEEHLRETQANRAREARRGEKQRGTLPAIPST
jgi:hypothetical protein